MHFLGLGINDPVPDAKTIWLFRDKLGACNTAEKLFSYLDKQLDKDGIIVHKGKLVDASVVALLVQRAPYPQWLFSIKGAENVEP